MLSFVLWLDLCLVVFPGVFLGTGQLQNGMQSFLMLFKMLQAVFLPVGFVKFTLVATMAGFGKGGAAHQNQKPCKCQFIQFHDVSFNHHCEIAMLTLKHPNVSGVCLIMLAV